MVGSRGLKGIALGAVLRRCDATDAVAKANNACCTERVSATLSGHYSHSERSEESSLQASEALHFVQGDNRETILTMAALTSQTETRADSLLLNIAAHLPLLADRRPDRPAVIHPQVGAHLTFRQLNEECDRYAWGLTRLG